MRLSIRDRIKAVARVLKIALNPKVSYLNLFWVRNEEGDISTHTFYVEGENPTDPFLVYMASVAGKSRDIAELNSRLEFYIGKAIIAYRSINSDYSLKLVYVAEPVRAILEDTDQEKQIQLEFFESESIQ